MHSNLLTLFSLKIWFLLDKFQDIRLSYWCFSNVSHVLFKFSGWYENPINSKVLVIPLDKVVFPTITLCPRDSRPDRWGSVMKIFDQLETECVPKRWDYVFNEKPLVLFHMLFKPKLTISFFLEIVLSV